MLRVQGRMRLSKRWEEGLDVEEKSYTSSAHGTMEFVFLRVSGVWQIDLYAYMRKEHKLESYKLGAVAAHFLKSSKVDLPISELFELFRQGTPQDLSKIGEYCLQDTLLPLQLMQHLRAYQGMLAMARATHVPVDYIIPRGLQVKIFSYIVRKAGEQGYVVPTIKREDTEEDVGEGLSDDDQEDEDITTNKKPRLDSDPTKMFPIFDGQQREPAPKCHHGTKDQRSVGWLLVHSLHPCSVFHAHHPCCMQVQGGNCPGGQGGGIYARPSGVP